MFKGVLPAINVGKTFENVFLVVQATVQKKLTQFGLYNLDSSQGFQIM